MAAESDRLPILVAAIGIAAVVCAEFVQRDQPRLDPDTAQLDRLCTLGRRRERRAVRHAASPGSG